MNKPTSARDVSSIDLAHHIIKKWQQDEATSQLFGPSTELDAIDRLAGYIALAIEDVDQRGVIKGLHLAAEMFSGTASSSINKQVAVRNLVLEASRLESELNTEPGEGSK